MKKLFLMMSVLLSAGLFCACSNDSDGDDDINGKGNIINGGEGAEPSDDIADMNVLYIQSDNGDADTCKLEQPKCGTFSPDVKYPDYSNNSYREVYPMSLMARITKSSIFHDYVRPYTFLLIFIESTEMININDLNVGDTFDSSDIRLMVVNYLGEPKYAFGYLPEYRAQSGQIQVVNRKTGIDGKRYLTLSLQDIKFSNSYDGEWAYTFNATVDYEICDYTHEEQPDMESLLKPSPDLLFFMMEELHGYESQGQCPFFSKDTGAQECLIINSEEEFREAYKSEKELPKTGIDFKYCTLVIGRTYGENGGVTLGDYELVDNGDSYQINVTLNNNVNPDYTYTPAVKDLYFWRIYPKMENKPVVFNRIRKDVNIDPLDKESAYSQICGRWILELYADEYSGFTNLPVNNSKRYSIEVTDNGWIKGYIDDTNVFSCNYMITYTAKQYYNGYNLIDHGIIKLWDWEGTNVNNDDPISKMFMQISNVTQFRLITTASRLTLDISASEWLFFHRED